MRVAGRVDSNELFVLSRACSCSQVCTMSPEDCSFFKRLGCAQTFVFDRAARRRAWRDAQSSARSIRRRGRHFFASCGPQINIEKVMEIHGKCGEHEESSKLSYYKKCSNTCELFRLRRATTFLGCV